MVDDTTRFERSGTMMVAEMDGDLVMMDVEKGSYFAINAVGGHLWALLETPQTLPDMVASVQGAFAADDASQIRTDVERFLADMLEHGLMCEVGA